MAIDAESLRPVLQTIGVGVAVVERGSWNLLFENAKFFQWFPLEVEQSEPTLDERIPDLDLDKVASRVSGGRPFEFDTEVTVGARAIPLRIDISRLGEEGSNLVLVQATNISKQREAEYMLDSYSKLAEKNARELEREKERAEKLLLNIMPRPVYEEMRDYGTATPQHFESASIVMLDFVGFTKMAISHDATAVVAELNDLFSAFDRIVDMFGCERLRTIGDAYLAVSGIPEPTPEHAHNAARSALRMRRYLEKRNVAHSEQWLARIGINSGEVIGSLVGVQKYVYDLFGPGINLAARMESMSEPMMITLNQDTYELLKDDFSFTDRGEFEVKGFDTQRLYALDSEYSDR